MARTLQPDNSFKATGTFNRAACQRRGVGGDRDHDRANAGDLWWSRGAIRILSAGNSLIRHVFLIKHERHALEFSCVFYKPKDRWMANTILWDDARAAAGRVGPRVA